MNYESWIPIIHRACKRFKTPFYIFSHAPIRTKLEFLEKEFGPHVTNWLSLKTLTLPCLLRWWLKLGLGVEVVSEYELLAALEVGYPTNRILVNGVAKHAWGKRCWRKGLRVNFDSIKEIESLSLIAKSGDWQVGIRFHPTIQKDPENREFSDQFGIPSKHFKYACDLLKKEQFALNTIHIHLRSNIPNLRYHESALEELRRVLDQTKFELKYLDLGGGLPATGVEQFDPNWRSSFSVVHLGKLIQTYKENFPAIKEFMLENGRYVLSNCGVLVFSVTDIKETDGSKILICDGGRVNHALPSDWEKHEVGILPNRSGEPILTSICGPTCMAFDCISRENLPNDIQEGDKVIWFDAGAYHLSWENRFSQPLARVLWHDAQDDIIETRRTETFHEWWKGRYNN